MKSSEIGGQAVLEGVMMKNKSNYSVAVRLPDGQVSVMTGKCKSISDKAKIFKLPIIRGVVAFVESLVLGMQTLTYSSSFYEEESKKAEEAKEKEEGADKEAIENIIVVVLAIFLAVGVFMLLPFFLSELLRSKIRSQTALAVLEGVLRIVLFLGYVIAISFLGDIKRVFMYHGAEHKTINCVENGLDLTVENVRKQTKHHRRCGTSFLLVVMFFSILFFLFIHIHNIWLRMAFRILLIPVIAGVSYEFIRFAGNTDNKIIMILSKPGMLLQRLTTREPEDSMIEVAIASVEAVFDWREYQRQLLEEMASQKNGKTEFDGKAVETVNEKSITENTIEEKSTKGITVEEKNVEEKTAEGENSVGKFSTEKMFVQNASEEEKTLVQNVSGEEKITEKVSIQNSSMEKVSTEKTSLENTSEETISTEKTSVEEISTDQSPTEKFSDGATKADNVKASAEKEDASGKEKDIVLRAEKAVVKEKNAEKTEKAEKAAAIEVKPADKKAAMDGKSEATDGEKPDASGENRISIQEKIAVPVSFCKEKAEALSGIIWKKRTQQKKALAEREQAHRNRVAERARKMKEQAERDAERERKYQAIEQRKAARLEATRKSEPAPKLEEDTSDDLKSLDHFFDEWL